jgi:hypothetical protein
MDMSTCRLLFPVNGHVYQQIVVSVNGYVYLQTVVSSEWMSTCRLLFPVSGPFTGNNSLLIDMTIHWKQQSTDRHDHSLETTDC